MRIALSLVFLALIAIPAAAQESTDTASEKALSIFKPADEANLNEFLWINRPLIVFADAPEDPRFILQMEFLSEEIDALAKRDVVVLTDTAPSAMGPLREKLRPRGFMLVLIGKDGVKYLSKPFPWHVREITRVIDKMPTFQQEMRERRGES